MLIISPLNAVVVPVPVACVRKIMTLYLLLGLLGLLLCCNTHSTSLSPSFVVVSGDVGIAVAVPPKNIRYVMYSTACSLQDLLY